MPRIDLQQEFGPPSKGLCHRPLPVGGEFPKCLILLFWNLNLRLNHTIKLMGHENDVKHPSINVP